MHEAAAYAHLQQTSILCVISSDLGRQPLRTKRGDA